jgi:hypothetical protein
MENFVETNCGAISEKRGAWSLSFLQLLKQTILYNHFRKDFLNLLQIFIIPIGLSFL